MLMLIYYKSKILFIHLKVLLSGSSELGRFGIACVLRYKPILNAKRQDIISSLDQ